MCSAPHVCSLEQLTIQNLALRSPLKHRLKQPHHRSLDSSGFHAIGSSLEKNGRHSRPIGIISLIRESTTLESHSANVTHRLICRDKNVYLDRSATKGIGCPRARAQFPNRESFTSMQNQDRVPQRYIPNGVGCKKLAK